MADNCPTGIEVTYTPMTFPPGTVFGEPFCIISPADCCASGSGPVDTQYTNLAGQSTGDASTCPVALIIEYTPVTLPPGYSWGDGGKICLPECLAPGTFQVSCCPPGVVMPNNMVATLVDLSPGGHLGVYAGTYFLRGWNDYFVLPSGCVLGIGVGCTDLDGPFWGATITVSGLRVFNCSGYDPTDSSPFGLNGYQDPYPIFQPTLTVPPPPGYPLAPVSYAIPLAQTNSDIAPPCVPFHYSNCESNTSTGGCVNLGYETYAYPPNMNDAPSAVYTDQMGFYADQPVGLVASKYPYADLGLFYGYPDLLLVIPDGITVEGFCPAFDAGVTQNGNGPLPAQEVLLVWNGNYWAGSIVIPSFGISPPSYLVNIGLIYGFYNHVLPPTFDNSIPPTDGIWRLGPINVDGGISIIDEPEGILAFAHASRISADPVKIAFQPLVNYESGIAIYDDSQEYYVTLAPNQSTGLSPPLAPPPPGIPPLPSGTYVAGANIEFSTLSPQGVTYGTDFVVTNPTGCCGSPAPTAGSSSTCFPTLGESAVLSGLGIGSQSSYWGSYLSGFGFTVDLPGSIAYTVTCINGVYMLYQFTGASESGSWIGTIYECGPPIVVTFSNGFTLTT